MFGSTLIVHNYIKNNSLINKVITKKYIIGLFGIPLKLYRDDGDDIQNNLLIGITGKKGVGKDTVADFLVDTYAYNKYAFADPLKRGCMEMFGLNYDQVYETKEVLDEYWGITPRYILQTIGTDLVRENFDKNFWVLRLEKDIKKKILSNNIVISDVRFQNEVDMIRKYNGIIIKVERETHYVDVHISEKGLDDYDYLIFNNGTEKQLYDKINKILQEHNLPDKTYKHIF